MALQVYTRTKRLESSPGTVYAWHARPGALQRLSPPWVPFEVVERDGGIEDGARAVLRMGVGPLRMEWVAEHRGHEPDRGFRDVQVRGPFARWEHAHRFEPLETGGCLLEDRVEYELPLEPLGGWIAGAGVRRSVDRAFAYRHRVTARDLALHRRYAGLGARRFAVSGATGLIGSALAATLSTGGHEVRALARPSSGRADATAGRISWDPRTGEVDAAGLEGVDFVVHLAGENIAGGRWTEERRERILRSREEGTLSLARALAGLARPPRALICASATGVYGDRGDERLDENAVAGDGFLAEVCRRWEAAADPAREAGIRTVHLRFGFVLTPAGGALARMLPPFRLGLGGRLGSGSQWWSWVSRDDVVGAVLHAAATESLSGPVNVVAPEPCRNREFTEVLGRVLRRPTLLPVPERPLHLLMGEMADELLLSSARVEPERLLASGYEFRDPRLEPALRHLLGRVREPGR